MDVYFSYNQISIHEVDKDNITFMIEHANYQYNIMFFGPKNACVMYQNDE